MSWVVIEVGDDVHVLPQDDLREHVAARGCWCHPTPDAEDESVCTHHSLDRREEYESGAENARQPH